jgi:anti-sigma regulatory factor (Ser/Thr protein kinase)
VTARLSATEGVFVVQDAGRGFDIAKVPDPTDPHNLALVCGRGILLMRSFMTELRFSEGGTKVTMVKRK